MRCTSALTSRRPSAKTREVEAVIKEIMDSRDSIDIFYTTVGTSSSFSGGFTALAGGGGTNTATIEILLKKNASMNREADILREEIAASVGGEGKIMVTPLSASMGSFDPSAFRVYLTSDNYSEVSRCRHTSHDISGRRERAGEHRS